MPILGSILSALPAVACAGDPSATWSPQSDLAYYTDIEVAAADPSADVFPAYLAAALQSSGYRRNADYASKATCDAWMAIQRVGVYSSTYHFMHLCRNGEAWTGVRGGAVADAEFVTDGLPSDDLNQLLSRSVSVTDGPRLGVGFDALATYVTIYDGRSVGRFAIYGVEDGRSDTVQDFRVVKSLVLDIERVVLGSDF